MKIRLLLILALSLLLTAGAAGADVSTWLTSVGEAVDLAAEEDRLILVDLYADWCGWCKVLEKEVFASPEFRDYAKDFVLLRVDTEDGGEGSALQARYGAATLPTTLILDAGLVKVGSVSGYAPTGEFIAHLERKVEGYRTMLAFYDKVLESDDVELQRSLAEDLHGRGDGQRAARLYERLVERVAAGTDTAAWLHYMAADAHRLSRDFEAAESHLQRTRAMASDLEAPGELLERTDLLHFHLAQDVGDCAAAVASLERFLEIHPKSPHSTEARRTLRALQRGDGTICA